MMHRALLVCAVSYMTLGSLAFSIVPLETPSVNITARVIQNVQKSILDGLGLSSAPNINRTGIQHADAKRMLERYHRISGSEVIPETIVVGDEVDQHIFETILLLAQQEMQQSSDVIPFPLRMRDKEGKVTTANLVMLLKHKRGHGRSRVKRPGRKIHATDRIMLKVAHLRRDGREKVLTRVETTVRHTRWVRLTLSVSTIRRALKDGDNTLFLRVTCRNCDARVKPILMQKKKKFLRRKSSRISRSANTKRKRKVKRNRRGPKYNKKWPYLVLGMRANMDMRMLNPQDTACQVTTDACCIQRLYINFIKDMGWKDWIISPKNYVANYCAADCPTPNPFSVPPHYTSSARVSSTRGDTRCCGPTSLSALSILHYDEYGKIVKTDIPNMSIDECGCL